MRACAPDDITPSATERFRDVLIEEDADAYAPHAGQLQRHQRVFPGGRSDHRRRRGPVRYDDGWWSVRRWHGVRDCQDRQRLRQHADHSGQLQRHQRVLPGGWVLPGGRSDHRRRRGPVRHDDGRWGERPRHGVRDRQDRQRICQHADHSGHLHLVQRVLPGGWSDHRRRRGPIRHDIHGRGD